MSRNVLYLVCSILLISCSTTKSLDNSKLYVDDVEDFDNYNNIQSIPLSRLPCINSTQGNILLNGSDMTTMSSLRAYQSKSDIMDLRDEEDFLNDSLEFTINQGFETRLKYKQGLINLMIFKLLITSLQKNFLRDQKSNKKMNAMVVASLDTNSSKLSKLGDRLIKKNHIRFNIFKLRVDIFDKRNVVIR